MKGKSFLLISLLLLFSCGAGHVLLEKNILKMEVSARTGEAPMEVEVNCFIDAPVDRIPCLDEEWYCWPGEAVSSLNYLSKIIVENDCQKIKRSFSMPFTLETPGVYTIELVLKRKSGEVFARVSSYPIIVK